jgi:hypothetical protein
MRTRSRLAIIALFCGTISMALAVIPSIIYDEPQPLFRYWKDSDEPKAKRDGEVEIATKRFSFTIGLKPEQPTPITPVAVSPVRYYSAAAIGVALVGLTLCALSWRREHIHSVVGIAAILCCAAIIWQYVVVGIVIGVIIAVVLIVLSNM